MVINLQSEKVISQLIKKIKETFSYHEVQYLRQYKIIKVTIESNIFILDVSEDNLPEIFSIEFFLNAYCFPLSRFMNESKDLELFIQPKLTYLGRPEGNFSSVLNLDKPTASLWNIIPVFREGLLEKEVNLYQYDITLEEVLSKNMDESTLYVSDEVGNATVYKMLNKVNPVFHPKIEELVISGSSFVSIVGPEVLITGSGSYHQFSAFLSEYCSTHLRTFSNPPILSVDDGMLNAYGSVF